MQTSLSPPLDPTLHSASIFRLFVLSVRKMKAIKCYNIHSFYFPRKNIISKIFITLIKSYVDDYFRISCYKLNPTPPLSTKSSPKLKGCPSFNVMKVFSGFIYWCSLGSYRKTLQFLNLFTSELFRKSYWFSVEKNPCQQ